MHILIHYNFTLNVTTVEMIEALLNEGRMRVRTKLFFNPSPPLSHMLSHEQEKIERDRSVFVMKFY